MRLKLVSLFLIFALSACTFQVEVIETPTPQIVEPSLTPFQTSTPIALSATPLPFPPDTPVPPGQVELATFPPPDVLPIVFPVNGTAQIVVGSVGDGLSQKYSLDAFQGQIMAVSILPENPDLQSTFELEIKGSDGTVLCPTQNYGCSFWRGVLPSTQRYFINITPQVGGVFKMRVSINPPGKANQYFAYDDPLGRYSLSFSDEFAPMHYNGIQASKFAPEFALEYIDTKQYVPTNLGEAYFLLGSSTDPQAVATCTEPTSFGAPEEIKGSILINGITFTKGEAAGVGAGNIYEQIFYRTAYSGTCFEVTYFIHYGNIGNYEPGLVHEFDEDALLRSFDQTLSTLVLK